MAVNMGSAVAYLELDTSRFSQGFKSAINDLKVFGDKSATAQQKMSGLSSTIKTVGSGLSKTVTLPLLGVGTAAVKAGADFESAMSQVAATMGKTTDQIQDLSKFAQKMGATTVFSATQAAEGLNILAQSGLDANQQMQALPDVLDLAAAGNLSLADSATYVVGTLKGFNKQMDEAKKVSDLIAKGATLANTNVKGLGEALSQTAATSSGYKQSLESTTLSLLRLAEQNITGAEAATALNRAMMDLYTPTTSAKKALDKLGISAYDANGEARDFNVVVDELSQALSGMSDEERNATANTIFTTYGLQAFNKMTVASTETVNKFKEGLEGASGSAMQQAQTQIDNLKGDITLFKSALEGTGIAISKVLIPNIRKVVQWATNLLTAFNSLDESQQKMIVTIATIVAAVGPALLIISKVVSLFSSVIGIATTVGSVLSTVFAGGLNAVALGAAGATGGVTLLGSVLTFLLSPIGLIIAAITALVAAFVLAYNKSETFRNAVNGLVDSIKTFFTQTIPEAFENFKTKIVETFEEAKTKVQDFVTSVVTFFQDLPYNIGYIIGEFLGKIYLFGTNLIEWAQTAIPQFIENVLTFFRQLPGNVWTWLLNTINRVIQFGSQLVTNGRQAALNFFNSVVNTIQNLPNRVWGIISQIPSKVRELGSQLRQAGISAFNALWDGIRSVGDSILGWVSDFASNITSFVSGIVDGFKSIVSGANDAKSAASSVKGRHANGLDYVPYNGYVAELHEGERVLTKQQNREYNESRTGTGGDTFNFYNTKPTPYEYARQMKRAKREALSY